MASCARFGIRSRVLCDEVDGRLEVVDRGIGRDYRASHLERRFFTCPWLSLGLRRRPACCARPSGGRTAGTGHPPACSRQGALTRSTTACFTLLMVSPPGVGEHALPGSSGDSLRRRRTPRSAAALQLAGAARCISLLNSATARGRRSEAPVAGTSLLRSRCIFERPGRRAWRPEGIDLSRRYADILRVRWNSERTIDNYIYAVKGSAGFLGERSLGERDRGRHHGAPVHNQGQRAKRLLRTGGDLRAAGVSGTGVGTRQCEAREATAAARAEATAGGAERRRGDRHPGGGADPERTGPRSCCATARVYVPTRWYTSSRATSTPSAC